MNESEAQPATVDDVPGIVRLVGEMYSEMAVEYTGSRSEMSSDWRDLADAALRERLGVDVNAFVVRHPSGDVVAVAVGRLQRTLPSPRRVGTVTGYIEWVATDSVVRRRGHARDVVSALLKWFDARVDVNASSIAEPLYRQFGFDDDGPVALSRRL
jgi:ribosomal protein S18 acetylase RimI-like enzyme